MKMLNNNTFEYFLGKRNYKTIASHNKDVNKEVGETRHYTPAIREWSNSVYSYNNSRDSFTKDSMANNVIKSYFNSVRNPLESTKSKRMRDLIRRSSTNRLFISKPLIKQSNDKATVTVFLYDRLKKKFNKKLFYLKNDLNYLLNNNTPKRSIKFKQFNKRVSRFNTNYSTYPNLVNTSLLHKKQSLKTLFFYYFLKWSLSAFKISIIMLKKGDSLIIGNNKYNINHNMFVLFSKKNKITGINNRILTLGIDEFYKTINVNINLSLKDLKIINLILYNYLHILITKSLEKYDSVSKITEVKYKIYLLFKFFKNKYYKTFIKKYLKKEYLAINYLYRLYLNKIKVNNLLVGLKYILSQIYNKKIEFNIINLKYLHLNSDIFTDAITIKLRRKTSKLLRVLRKSLKLVKIPEKIRVNNNTFTGDRNEVYNPSTEYKGININSLYSLVNKSRNFKTRSQDRLTTILNSMFSKSSNAVINNNSLHTSILTSLKYKWITGVRLEAKGRLTKRFTASRSLFKFKYKGNLRNLDYLNKSFVNTNSDLMKNYKDLNKTPNLYIIRNQVKPNLQYTSSSSKKRIGTFGIKGWISSN